MTRIAYIIASALFDTKHLWDVWMWIWEDRRKVVIGYAATPSSSCPSSCCDAVGFVLLLAPTAVPKASERKRWTHIQEGSHATRGFCACRTCCCDAAARSAARQLLGS